MDLDATLVPVAGLDELDAHLDDLLAAGTQPPPVLDAALFDRVELQLSDAHVGALVPRLLPRIVALLKTPTASAARDATVLASMAMKLLRPVPFADVLPLAAEDDLVAALGADAAPAMNLLAVAVVRKAADGSPATAAAHLARLAAMPALLTAFVVRWLASPAVEVGERSGRVLGDLLDVDCPLPPPARREARMLNGASAITIEEPDTGTETLPTLRRAPGPGVLWRRILHDRAVLDRLRALCRGTADGTNGTDGSDGSDDTAHALQATIAQGRLLRVLPRLAALHLAEVAPAGGLLPFAALHMVDRSDELMHRSLVDFFEALVSILRIAAGPPASPQHDYTVQVLRALLRDATADDALLAAQLRSLPDRIVPEEADALRAWLRELLPPPATRVAGWQ